MVGLAQQEGIELAKRHTWQVLTKEQTFTSVAAETQSSAMPSDFDRYIDETFYNRTARRRVFGPLNPQEWQFNKSVVAATVIENWRQRGDDVLIAPTPAAGQTYAFEYVSTKWCQSSGGTEQTSWLADTDTGLLSEHIMTLGVIWRFLSAKGFDYAETLRSYEIAVTEAASRDGGKRTLNSGDGYRNFYKPSIYVSDGSWSV